MSVKIFSKDDHRPLFYIDSLSYISNLFDNINKLSKENYQTILQAIFDIKTPFLMDGEANKLFMKVCENNEEIFNKNNKRIYEEHFSNKIPKKMLSPMELININVVKEGFLNIQNTSEYENFFKFSSSVYDISQNNNTSRKARDIFLSATEFQSIDINGKNQTSKSDIHKYNDHKYLIPANCHYINGDILKLEAYFQGENFDLVVMDPPWRNKHIRRRKRAKGIAHSYEMMTVGEVMNIPLGSILSEDAFVLIWVTSNPSIYQDLMQSLILWDLKLITSWFWVKVTKAGEPVVNLDASVKGKLPYEKILVTRRRNCNKKFPNHLLDLIFCSIPCSVHSHKPPLKDLLECTLNVNKNWKCLELFARCLTPNWTSLGKEVLKFQDLALLEEFKNV